MRFHSRAILLLSLIVLSLLVTTIVVLKQNNTNAAKTIRGMFVAVGDGNNAAYSYDGVSWHGSKLPFGDTSSLFGTCVISGKGIFLALPLGSRRIPAKAAYSSDGIHWHLTNGLPINNVTWLPAAYGNGIFVAACSSDASIAHSPNGFDWTLSNKPPLGTLWRSIAYGNGVFVLIGAVFDRGVYSYDGINWLKMPTPFAPGSPENWQALTFGAGKFVMLTQGASACSTDGTHWTVSKTIPITSWASVTYGNGVFVAVSSRANKDGAYSADGIVWYPSRPMPYEANWKSVTYGNRLFVAVGDGNAVAYSRDGITWHHANDMPLAALWGSVSYGEVR